MDKVKYYAKFVAAILGAVLTAGSEVVSIIPDNVRPWLVLGFVVATAIAVYAVPNKQDDPLALDPSPSLTASDEAPDDKAAPVETTTPAV